MQRLLSQSLLDMCGIVTSLKDHDLVCHIMCYKFFTRMLKCDVCTLSSEAIVSELQTKYTYLMRMIDVVNHLLGQYDNFDRSMKLDY